MKHHIEELISEEKIAKRIEELGKEITEEKNEEVIETKSDQTENQDDKSTITKKDIMQELDALKIEYDSKMTKDELLKLLQG